MSSTIDPYFKRYLQYPQQIETPPFPSLGMVVVVPCYNEPDLLATLDSLHQAEPPSCAVEVLVVLNSSERSPDEHLARNQQTRDELEAWANTHNQTNLRVFGLWHPNLPRKTAGVGAARKIGMDEALSRLHSIEKPEGLIVCLDADCTVAPNYFTAIEEEFARFPEATGAAIHYEHPLDLSPSEPHRQAIIDYELHLRYYVRALRYAGIQHACHTVGSTMTVRANAYARMGGMNRRKAGEDFYFMVKLAKTNLSFDLTSTTVYPSPRISLRVPFGTGKAIHAMTESEGPPEWPTYHPKSFEQLRQASEYLLQAFSSSSEDDNDWLVQQPEPMQQFLLEQNLHDRLAETRSNTTSAESYQRRLLQWLDPFVAMKWVHFSRDRGWPNVQVADAARWLWERERTQEKPRLQTSWADTDSVSLLHLYRRWDQTHPIRPTPR